jgi:Late exocytosis, associated with Golgi transport
MYVVPPSPISMLIVVQVRPAAAGEGCLHAVFPSCPHPQCSSLWSRAARLLSSPQTFQDHLRAPLISHCQKARPSFLSCVFRTLNASYPSANASRHYPMTFSPGPAPSGIPIPRSCVSRMALTHTCSFVFSAVRLSVSFRGFLSPDFVTVMVIILLPIWFVSWTVLLPVNGVRPNSGLVGLDRFTFGNIPPNAPDRYAAHIILAWLFTGVSSYH